MNVNPITQQPLPLAGSVKSIGSSEPDQAKTGPGSGASGISDLPVAIRGVGQPQQTGGPLYLRPATHAPPANIRLQDHPGQETKGAATTPALTGELVKSIVADIIDSITRPGTGGGTGASEARGIHPALGLPRATHGGATAEARSPLLDPTGLTVFNPLATDRPVDLVSTTTIAPPAVKGITDELVGQLIGVKDLNDDGVLTNDELNLNPARFDAIDQDKDGQITGKELFIAIQTRFDAALSHNQNLDPEQFARRFLDRIELFSGGQTARPEPGIGRAFPPGAVDVPPVVGAPPPPAYPAGAVDQPPRGYPAGAVDVPPSPDLVASAGDRMADFIDRLDRSSERPSILAPDLRSQLEEVATKIAERLDEAGYRDKPPTNIRDLVRSLGLDIPSSNMVLKMMAAKYPHGLGIELFA